MFPEWTWIVGLMIGAAIGSFLNVVIYRMPRLMSLSEPKNSFCPSCKNQLFFYPDMIPLFSWIVSKGKCRYCDAKIGPRYFWVELINGSIWAVIWYRYFCAEPTGKDWMLGCAFMLAAAALVAIIFIDGEHFIIPDEINAFLLVVGLVFHLVNGSITTGLIGYLVGWGALFGIALLGRLAFGKDAMGHGDIKMMRGVGALLGAGLTVVSIGIAVIAGLVFGILFIAIATAKAKQSGEAQELSTEAEAEEDYEPESVKDLIILGLSYLVCLDIVAIKFPKLYEKMGYPIEDVSVEEDDWKPTMTTIPFGPYLAVGALVCMIFRPELNAHVENFFQMVSGPTP